MQDLGMMPPTEPMASAPDDRRVSQVALAMGAPMKAVLTTLVACAVLAQAEAQPQSQPGDESHVGDFDFWFFVGSVMLMMLGVVYAGQLMSAGVQRLWASSPCSESKGESPVIVVEKETESEDEDECGASSCAATAEAATSTRGTEGKVSEETESILKVVGGQSMPQDSPTHSSGMTASSSSQAISSRKRSVNPWNLFQQQNAGKGWAAEKMRAEYYRQRPK